ncbi:MAB_1171c family putative transporter [Streptomyces sp. NPDC004610]|uniref:MAB_1171c family putative transporter n=1 Tax=unclassified Streptomyces TaxID=2593676 RepID=UPI0033B461EF
MKSGPDNTLFYLCGALLLAICLAKFPALFRRPQDMLLRAACLLLFTGAMIFFFAAPDSIAALNRFTGVPNFAAPVAYSSMIAFSGASLLLIINWRPAPPERTRRASRICVAVYSTVIVAIVVLFWAGETPVEQITLFDAYYATTPYIREMIVTYLVAHCAATLATSVLCWRWSAQVGGFLRAGLLFLVPTYILHVCYDVTKLVAVVALWLGHDWSFLIDKVAPQFAAPSALFGVIGFALPLAGPRVAENLASLRKLRELDPLWRELRRIPTPGALRVSLPWWSPPAVRLTWRQTSIYDALLALSPYLDEAVRAQAYRAAVDLGDDEDRAAVTADVAMIVAAGAGRQRGLPERARPAAAQAPWRPHDLIPLSRALTSPVVAPFRTHPGASAESSTTHD